MAKVFVTGSTGFVGKRLIQSLLEEGHEVVALCRIRGTTVFSKERKGLSYIWGDLRNPETLNNLPTDIDAAYYLVHSMSEIVQKLDEEEAGIARGFIKAVQKTSVRQIIYLGGIINDETKLSPHLKSRLLVEEVLRKSGIPVTVLRASIILGEGSASFEIVRDLTEKLPLMIAPKWVKSLCQPIAIRDVLYYLTHVLLNEKTYNKIFDIGGPDALTFKELMLEYAKVRHLRRYIVEVPVLTPRLSSYWLVFITSVRFSICYYLVESMKSNSIVQRREIETLLPHRCLTCRESLEQALSLLSKNEVPSTWMDSWEVGGSDPDIKNYLLLTDKGCYKEVRTVEIQGPREGAIDRIWSIGGEQGYYAFNWAWTFRGFIDQMMGGIGLNRGRRHPSEIEVGDSIDFWRVLLADQDKGHLILFSAMKVPGEAWLEFEIKRGRDADLLIQTATFFPRGIFGHLYWILLYPMHLFIFGRMVRAIAGRRTAL